MPEQEHGKDNKIEQIPSRETGVEQVSSAESALNEAEKEIKEKAQESQQSIEGYRLPDTDKAGEKTRGVVAATNAQKIKAQRVKDIENVLARDLEDEFVKMSPEDQKEFKEKGEETAAKINILLEKAKANVGKIVKLIRKWLAMIPGVNKFFLEKEAKIKADEIIRLKSIS